MALIHLTVTDKLTSTNDDDGRPRHDMGFVDTVKQS